MTSLVAPPRSWVDFSYRIFHRERYADTNSDSRRHSGDGHRRPQKGMIPMMTPIKLAAQIIESLLAVVGVRVGTEEPNYTRRQLTDTVEIRRYGPRIAAETTVVGDENRARNVGFRRLAGYIFGGNRRDQTISMT